MEFLAFQFKKEYHEDAEDFYELFDGIEALIMRLKMETKN